MLQLARAVLDDVRHGAGRGMAGSLEAVLQEVHDLDQPASRFIAGERLEAALALDNERGKGIQWPPGSLGGGLSATTAPLHSATHRGALTSRSGYEPQLVLPVLA